MDILKSRIGILKERENASGLNLIALTLMEARNIALGRTSSGHLKSSPLCEVSGMLWKAEVMWEEPLTLLCNLR